MKTIFKNPSTLTTSDRVAQKIIRMAVKVPFIPSSRRYDITISSKHKFIWFRNPKVGTQTIFNRLSDDAVELDVESPYGIHYFPRFYSEYFKFAFVRNPWDRLVSAWHNKVVDRNFYKFDEKMHNKLKDFSNFVEWVEGLDLEAADIHLRQQVLMIDLDNCDFLGRMEKFEQDLGAVFNIIGLPNKSRRNENVTLARKTYREYYTDDLRDRVGKIYRRDIQIFGYEF